MRWRSALTGRSIVEAGIGSSSQDEGNFMLERQPRSVQDGIKNAPMATAETSSSKNAGIECAVILSIDVQGLGPWRGLGQRPNLTCFVGRWFGAGSHPPQHQSREAGSCLGANQPSKGPVFDVRCTPKAVTEKATRSH